MVDLAAHVLDTKASKFDPHKFKDKYETALKALVKRKAADKTIEMPEEKNEESNVIDLMDALKQSLGRKKVMTSPAKSRKRAGAPQPEAQSGVSKKNLRIEVMEARSVDAIPIGEEWQYEPKWDGFRCLAFKAGNGCRPTCEVRQAARALFPRSGGDARRTSAETLRP